VILLFLVLVAILTGSRSRLGTGEPGKVHYGKARPLPPVKLRKDGALRGPKKLMLVMTGPRSRLNRIKPVIVGGNRQLQLV
jgi:hypothetical protein